MLAEKFAEVSKEEVLKRVAAMEFDRNASDDRSTGHLTKDFECFISSNIELPA